MSRATLIASGACLLALVGMGARSVSGVGAELDAGELTISSARETADLPVVAPPIVAFMLPAEPSEDDEMFNRPALESYQQTPRWTVGAEAAAKPIGENLRPGQFPAREEWESFAQRLNDALSAGSLDPLLAMETEARTALAALKAIPGHVEYAVWLEGRLEEITVARLAAQLAAGHETGESDVPMYEAWVEWMRDRPAPIRAAALVPQLKPLFAAEQLPPALVWLAETESSFDPKARNRTGARGLYQLMPETARQLGLRLRPVDERLDPVRNARSAARYLAQLHAQYGDWPLALAAYNAGPTRVSRLLARHRATSFREIAAALPAETQLFVPRVLATLTVREGVTPAALALAGSALAVR